MLDLKFIRNNPDAIRTDLQKRKDDAKLEMFDRLLVVDNEVRALMREVQDLRTQRNKLSREIGEIKKSGGNDSQLVSKVNKVNEAIKKTEDRMSQLREELKYIQMRIPNILHDSVPYGEDEEDNVTVKTWGGQPEFDFETRSHVDLLEILDVGDIPRAAKIAGSRFFFLKNELVMLDLAMQQMGMEMLIMKGFTPMYPPFMMRRKPYEGVTDLADFEDVMYKIDGEDLFLIATSEHAMAAMHMDEVFEPTELPIRYAGISTNFRKEAGSHGKDTKGVFRVHQFSKVEQFVVSLPEQSWEIHEELLRNHEEYFQALKIPYRIVNVCTGDIGIVAAKKYDMEAWMPGQGKYREITSCSNCTAYQATRLNIKYRLKKGGTEKAYVHTLNSTMVANPRAIVAIMENYQREDGSIQIPKVLHKYLPAGMKEIVPRKK